LGPIRPSGIKKRTATFRELERVNESKKQERTVEAEKVNEKPLERGSTFQGLSLLDQEHQDKIRRKMSALQKLDVDGDGELEEQEVIEAYMEDGMSIDQARAKFQEMLIKYDLDGDGTVSIKEALNRYISDAMQEELDTDRQKVESEEEKSRQRHLQRTEERKKQRRKQKERK